MVQGDNVVFPGNAVYALVVTASGLTELVHEGFLDGPAIFSGFYYLSKIPLT